jgi:hypothetical protein
MKFSFIKKNLYIILIPLYPVILLIDINIGQFEIAKSVRSILLLFSISSIVVFLINKFAKEKYNSGFGFVFFVTIFFAYERIRLYFLISNFEFLGRHRFLLLFIGLLYLLVFFITKKYPIRNSLVLNAFSIVLIGMPFLNIIIHNINVSRFEFLTNDMSEIFIEVPNSEKPDINFIILDSYSRDDVLEDIYNFDNRPFIESLENLGFYVSKCSQSNYSHTQFSLASTLNLDTLQNLGADTTNDGFSYPNLWPLLHRSAIRDITSNAGYQYIAFNTSYHWADIEDADIYFSSVDLHKTFLMGNGTLNVFENLLIQNSFGNFLAEYYYKYYVKDGNTIKSDIYSGHRNRTRFVLSQLKDIPLINGIKFSHVHLIPPHAPFIFGPNGEEVTPSENETLETNRDMYKNQIIFMNKELPPVLSSIIENSDIPPIIILQGDHGGKDTFGEDRYAILNAIYMPYGSPDAFYPELSSVNTFRLILNEVFGNNLEYLPDLAYAQNKNGGFDIVKNNREGCNNTQE